MNRRHAIKVAAAAVAGIPAVKAAEIPPLWRITPAHHPWWCQKVDRQRPDGTWEMVKILVRPPTWNHVVMFERNSEEAVLVVIKCAFAGMEGDPLYYQWNGSGWEAVWLTGQHISAIRVDRPENLFTIEFS